MAGGSSGKEPTRREFIYVATGAMGVIMAGSAAWPLINQMNPDASVRALAAIEVDISAVEEGSQLVVKWRGKPVFIRRRTEAEIAEARAVALDDLPDAAARNANVADDALASDSDRSFGENGEWVIMMGVCTHLGCVPNMDGGEFGGWYCPCHGSHYDIAGRIRKGPAPENLPIPTVTFLDESTVRLG